MAFIVSDMVTKGADTQSPLSRVSFDRQKDIYRLAKRGDSRCRRLWQDFQAEQPGMARLVVADCDSDKALSVAANKHLDVVLSKGERPKKVKKPKAAKPDSVTKAAKVTQENLNRGMAARIAEIERDSRSMVLATADRDPLSRDATGYYGSMRSAVAAGASDPAAYWRVIKAGAA